MINLNSVDRDLKGLADEFYHSVETKVLYTISSNKTFLNGYKTDSSHENLGDFLEREIKDLLTLELTDLVTKFEIELHKLFLREYVTHKKTKSAPKRLSQFKITIDKILFYEDHDSWKAYLSAIRIGNNTCPYCNKAYITPIGNDSEKFVRGDFDHFLAKSIYPYFRFSFYNLIPCCVICNRNAKSDGHTSLAHHVHPFAEGFENNTKFTFTPKNYEELIGKGTPEIDFLFYGNDSQTLRAKGNIELFRLKEQYSIHTQELNDLIIKRRVFSDSYLQELQKNFPGLIKNFDDAYAVAFGKEINLAADEKRPLSKFTRDIVSELGFIQY